MSGYYRINIDGTIQSRSKQVDDTWLPLADLETIEDGAYATYYNSDGTIDLVKEEAEAKVQALSDANSDYEAQIQSLTQGVPEIEKSTWTKQELEARAYLADNTVVTPFIDSLSASRGVDKDYLVGKILEKADAYAIAVGSLTGLRQKTEDDITTA